MAPWCSGLQVGVWSSIRLVLCCTCSVCTCCLLQLKERDVVQAGQVATIAVEYSSTVRVLVYSLQLCLLYFACTCLIWDLLYSCLATAVGKPNIIIVMWLQGESTKKDTNCSYRQQSQTFWVLAPLTRCILLSFRDLFYQASLRILSTSQTYFETFVMTT